MDPWGSQASQPGRFCEFQVIKKLSQKLNEPGTIAQWIKRLLCKCGNYVSLEPHNPCKSQVGLVHA